MELLIVDGTRIRAAVAFVTEAGVKTLRGLVDGRDEITLELVARAADVIDPEALLALRHDLDAVVSVVIGRHASAFHPKLWPLDAAESMAIWTEWLAVIKKQRHHRNEIDRLGRNLARRAPPPDRRADKAVLIDDLDELYRLTVEANLSTPSGRVYVPSRFKQAIDRVRNGADPVQLVTRI